MSTRYKHLVRFGRVDGSATKTIFVPTRRDAFKLANALAFVFWHDHVFKNSECTEDLVAEDRGDFWIELIRQTDGNPADVEYLFQGADHAN